MQKTKSAAAAAPTGACRRERTGAGGARGSDAPRLRGDEGELLRRHGARLERSVARLAPWAPAWLVEEVVRGDLSALGRPPLIAHLGGRVGRRVA